MDCWKKSRELVNLLYGYTDGGSFSRDFGLKDQTRRAVVSVMANIAEGFGTQSNKEFVRFLGISIRSLYELQSHLYVAVDRGYITAKEFQNAEIICDDCMHLCKGFIRYLRQHL